jgi:hypothetical protein
MTDKAQDTWDDVRRAADELKLKLHLAGMDARDRWVKIQPRLAELEKSVESGAQKAGQALSEQFTTLGTALRELLADVTRDVTGQPPKKT